MKTKYLFMAAIGALTLVSCADESFVGDQEALNAASERPIGFRFELKSATRAESDHATSAANLGNQFIVWGEKSSGASDTYAAPATGNIVFPNYQVNYTANTAYNTTSNTKDWEYVGYTHSSNYQSNIKYKASASDAVTGSNVAQTIKYWDYSAGSYTFTAVAAANTTTPSVKHDIENGYIKIQKNIDDNDKASEKGYTVTVTADADLTKLYFSDRTVITKTAGTDRTATNAYGGNVTLKFRNALSQVRAGVYETIPGYAISDIHFYVTSDVEAKVSDVDAFGAICPNIKGQGYAGNLTVTYSEETATLNQPVVSASGAVAADLILGTNTNTVTTAAPLGTTATSPTWDTDGGTYTTVMLQGAHTTNLKLKCNYTLYNSVSGETIDVTGATAEVPYQYLQWKPNYKYTYLFKISDNTNGSSGEGVVGLYPITFDAVEVVNGDGLAEYITTVSEPSITTFGVKAGKYVTGGSEYAAGSDIYATIMDASAVKDFTLATDVNVYLVTTTDAVNFPITEASVAEALAETPAGSAKISCVKKNVDDGSCFTADPVEVTTVPGEDGVDITGTHALKLTGAVATTTTTAYAIEYIHSPEAFTTDGGKVYDADAFAAAGTLYTTADCDVVADAAAYSAAPSAKYYKKIVNKPGTKVYKVIRVN